MFPRIEDGKVMVPKRAEAEDGTIGDTWVELPPTDPDYARVLVWITKHTEEAETA